MAEYTIDKIEYGGNVYKLQDNISGYITGTIPTKTSDLTNDSGFITASHTSTYSLPTAVYNTLGGIKPAYSTTGTATLTTSSQAYTNSPTIAARTTTSGKYYGVEIDSNGRLFVNVPWTDKQVTTAALTTETLYYPILATGTGTATRQIDSTLKGLTYRSTAGTTSAMGSATLTLGNNISSGTANNEQGRLLLYSSNNYYVRLQADSLSAHRTIVFPNKAGTLAMESDITDKKLEVNALTSGTTYYPILATGTGTATRQIDSTLNGLTYTSIAGTTSTTGEAHLTLGNNIAEGTTNNEIGWIELFSNTEYRVALVASNLTRNRSIQFPDKSGTLATTTDIYESVSLTQAEYDALSSTDKADEKKIYYITDSNTDSSIEEMLNIFYPVGSYYETADPDFNPNLNWGGYWEDEEMSEVKIVEEGITNDWTYRKWSSGIAECWKTWTSASFSPVTSVGGFYGRVLPASGTFSLPSGLFVTAPIMSVNLTEWGSGYFWGSARAVTSTSFKMTLFRNDNASSDGVAKIYATGTWKTYEAPAPIYKWKRIN